MKKKLQEKQNLRTWIEIDKSALKNNYNIFRKIIGKNCLLMAVVKSNAYGHGLVDFSLAMQNLGVDWLGVDSIAEALTLRENKIKTPILVLGYTLPPRYAEAAKNNISITISNVDGLKNLRNFYKKYKTLPRVHLKIDTGMHRQGFLPEEMQSAINFVRKNISQLNIEGAYTHLAAVGNSAFPNSSREQLAQFAKSISLIKSSGLNPIIHAVATSGAMILPEAHFDMARIGIGIYDLWPSKETTAICKNRFRLKPILSWKTILSEIKALPKNSGIGYDFTEKLPKKSTVAVCPIGYWHGYPRNLSSIGKVLINGKFAKILGRVSMDMIVIDITQIPKVKIGQEVTLLGKEKNNEISAEQLADMAETINYEIVTRINPLIKRFYI